MRMARPCRGQGADPRDGGRDALSCVLICAVFWVSRSSRRTAKLVSGSRQCWRQPKSILASSEENYAFTAKRFMCMGPMPICVRRRSSRIAGTVTAAARPPIWRIRTNIELCQRMPLSSVMISTRISDSHATKHWAGYTSCMHMLIRKIRVPMVAGKP